MSPPTLPPLYRPPNPLTPSGASKVKYAFGADTLPDGTGVPAGAWVLFSPWAMGRDPKLWGADAREFRPERHLERPKPDPYVFTAFQAGPRQCLGVNMAYLEAKCALALLVGRYRFRLVPGHVVEPRQTVTLPMREGLLMTVEPRRPVASATMLRAGGRGATTATAAAAAAAAAVVAGGAPAVAAAGAAAASPAAKAPLSQVV